MSQHIIDAFFSFIDKLFKKGTFIATADFSTTIVDALGNDVPYAGKIWHIVTFSINSLGHRYSTLSSGDIYYAKIHSGVILAREIWRVHGILPNDAVRCHSSPNGKLVVFPGGKR